MLLRIYWILRIWYHDARKQLRWELRRRFGWHVRKIDKPSCHAHVHFISCEMHGKTLPAPGTPIQVSKHNATAPYPMTVYSNEGVEDAVATQYYLLETEKANRAFPLTSIADSRAMSCASPEMQAQMWRQLRQRTGEAT